MNPHKRDLTDRAAIRGVCLINIVYEALSSVLCEKLNPTVRNLIEIYHLVSSAGGGWGWRMDYIL